MTRNRIVPCIVVVMLVQTLSVRSAAEQFVGHQNLSINVAVERRSGEKTRGSATITLNRVNVLRYDVVAGVSVTFTGGPDLRVPFIPPIPAVGASTPPPAKVGEGGAAVTPTPANLLQRLSLAEAERLTKVQAAIERVISKANISKQTVDALVLASDGVLRTSEGPAQLIETSKAAVTTIADALANTWPAGEVLTQLVTLAGIRTDLNGLTNVPPADQPVRDYIAARLTVLEAWYATVTLQSEAARAAGEAQAKLAAWKPILDSIVRSGVDAFTLPPIEVTCGFQFELTKESKVELIKRDRQAPAGTPEAREEIVTVVCSSSVSISAGFGLSDADRKIVGIVPGVKTVTANGETTTTNISIFGLTEQSTYRTVPMLLANIRIFEPNDVFSVHGTVGSAVAADGSPGVDIDYVVGGSVAIKRQFFITAGWLLANKNVLQSGFLMGAEVPNGVTPAPVRKERLTGHVLAFTFKIR